MFLVGMIGLAQFLPMFALALIAGETADRYDRRKILLYCGALQVSCAAAFTLLSMQAHPPLMAIFVVAGFFGIGRTFSMPAGASLVPLLVPIDELPKAIAWNTFSVQSGMILGPWIGGVLCGLAPVYANATACALYMLACMAWVVLVKMPLETRAKRSEASRLTMIREGLTHLWGSKIVLGAISLDLFAVLLGGVTALLPAFAKDILFIGPEGFGQLRASFAAGAGCTGASADHTACRKMDAGRRDGLWPCHALLCLFTRCAAVDAGAGRGRSRRFHFRFRAAESGADRHSRRDARKGIGRVGIVHQRFERAWGI